MKIISPAFNHLEKIPAQYTCDGENINPPLEFIDVSENAQSLVLICDDPDAPSCNWTHWTVWNINPKTPGIAENSVPSDAMEGATDFGKPGYGGPCPPAGEHRYFFRLYSLDDELFLIEDNTKQDLLNAMAGHIIDQAELVGVYGRN